MLAKFIAYYQKFSDMKEGNPYRLLLLFTIPLLIGNIMQQLYQFVDSIIVGNYVGVNALAAVGASSQILQLFLAGFIGLGLGAMILVAQFYGKRDYETLQKLLQSLYVIILLVTPLVSVLGIIFARPILIGLQMSQSPEALEQAVIYLRILMLGLIAQLGFNLQAGFLQGIGDSLSSLLFLIVASISNITLDSLFVIFFHWGIEGAAWATVISQVLAWVYGILFINHRYDFLHIGFSYLKAEITLVIKMFKLGFPSALQIMCYGLGNLVITALVNYNGKDFMAGFTAGNKLDSFVFLPVLSLSTALTTYVGQNLSTGDLKRLMQGLKASIILQIFIGGGLALGMYFTRYYFVSWFSSEELVQASGALFLACTMPFYGVLGIFYSFNAFLQGIGNVYIPLIQAFFIQCLLRAAAAYGFFYLLGHTSVYWSFPFTWIAGLLGAMVYFYSGHWKKRITIFNTKENLLLNEGE